MPRKHTAKPRKPTRRKGSMGTAWAMLSPEQKRAYRQRFNAPIKVYNINE